MTEQITLWEIFNGGDLDKVKYYYSHPEYHIRWTIVWLLEMSAAYGYVHIMKYAVSIGVNIDRHGVRALVSALRNSRHDAAKYIVSLGVYSSDIDLYNYINVLCPEHLKYDIDPLFRRVIIARENQKRLMHVNTQYSDVIVVTIQ